MAPKQLLIKQLSASGQVLRKIECAAGQITVLRAQAVSDLKPYQRALAGLSGGERFILTVDSDPYEAYNHDLVGFGEQFKSGPYTVRDFLTENGIAVEEIRPSLVAFGLEERIETQCSALSPQDARLLRLVTATYSQNKILVLNDPFEPLSGQWKERCAELIVHHARMNSRVVIVAALSSRPECWIDNELIVRTQVGETRQKTIGFSSAPSEIKEALQQLRGEVVQEHNALRQSATSQTVATGALIATNPIGTPLENAAHRKSPLTLWQRSYQILTTPLPVSPLTVFFSLTLLTAGVLYKGYKEIDKDSNQSINIATSLPAISSASEPNNIPPPLQEEAAAQNLEETEAEAPSDALSETLRAPISSDLLLDLYPENIKLSVLHTFEGKNIEIPVDSVEASSKPSNNSKSGSSDLLKMLENASETAQPRQNSDNSNPTYTENVSHEVSEQDSEESANWEHRREMMRRKFLDSIQAASGDD